MKKVLPVILVCLLLASCASTGAMVDNTFVNSTDISIEQKLEELGYDKISMTYPEVYYDGCEWQEELIRQINKSENFILITCFLASECDENTPVYEALCNKAEQGVEIYFVYDSTGAMDLTESKNHMRPLNFLRESGVHTLEFNPFSFNRITDPAGMMYREHRKFFVFDGETVVLGGMNMNYISLTSVEAGTGQRDSMYVFKSPSLAQCLMRNFEDFWNTYSWETISVSDLHCSVDDSEEYKIEAYLADQYSNKTVMPQMLGSLLYSAEKSVHILPFLPILDKNMKTAFSDATSRGVEVELIIPNDPREDMYKAAHYSAMDLINCGITVFGENNSEETSQLLHEKLVIVDGEYVVIGSMNMNYRSMALSQEITLVIHDKAFATEIENHYQEIKSRTTLMTKQDAEQFRNIGYWINYLIKFMAG